MPAAAPANHVVVRAEGRGAEGGGGRPEAGAHPDGGRGGQGAPPPRPQAAALPAPWRQGARLQWAVLHAELCRYASFAFPAYWFHVEIPLLLVVRYFRAMEIPSSASCKELFGELCNFTEIYTASLMINWPDKLILTCHLVRSRYKFQRGEGEHIHTLKLHVLLPGVAAPTHEFQVN